MKRKLKQEILDHMSRDPSNWKGPFYSNRKDPRLLVPKLNPSLGWTFNFGNVYAYLALAVIIILIVLSQYGF